MNQLKYSTFVGLTCSACSTGSSFSDSPRADPHEGDGGTGEENRHEEEGLPAPDIRQCPNQRSRQKRQEALRQNTNRQRLYHRPETSVSGLRSVDFLVLLLAAALLLTGLTIIAPENVTGRNVCYLDPLNQAVHQKRVLGKRLMEDLKQQENVSSMKHNKAEDGLQ